MKLIYHITLILWFSVKSNSQKFPHEQFPFPPQFKSPNPPNGVFGSDKSIYLPPESHTTVPYFSMNNGNSLPFQFLPPTASKVPSAYPTPFPMMMSSTMVSRKNEEEHDDKNEDNSKARFAPFSNQIPPGFRVKSDNETDKNIEKNQEREMRASKNFNFQHPIDRVDTKYPPQIHTATQRTLLNQTPTLQRRMIISRETLQNEQIPEQIKRASILGPQSISSPITYYSTTEPAIPILRLSNEMDLDGSFSYEALGADQTHYVQHSRMENSGTDKEEQIVEGSYSYVGDNGQTYTVHYVADSNGYRASGDHLPVPPPIPEIIQRAIQYNLAEEAKKPAHLKSWQENEKEYENSEAEKHRFSILPPRNLFTGRTPEAFSFGLTQPSLLQNKIAIDDNSQSSSKINLDFSADQSKTKINNGPITPQITFLASQGAHKPSLTANHQQMSRIFPSDKPTLPQLMNYEAGNLEADQENNKALWRWQYGLNGNGAVENQHPNKNSISRSFGEGDDVIINFNNMSPEQYTNMIKNDFLVHNSDKSIIQSESKSKETINTESTPFMNPLISDNSYVTTSERNGNIQTRNQYEGTKNSPIERESASTENTMVYPVSSDWSQHVDNMKYNEKLMRTDIDYLTPTPYPAQSYAYSDSPYESTSTKSNAQTIYDSKDSSNLFNVNKERSNDEKTKIKPVEAATENIISHTKFSTNDVTLKHDNNIKFTDFIQKEDKSNFKPIVNINVDKENDKEAITTETSLENIIRDNIFLKNLFKQGSAASNDKKEAVDENKKVHQVKIDPKFDKAPKFIQFQSKHQNELKSTINKPLDMTDVLNYITLKNHFESSKLKSKNTFSNSDRLVQRIERPKTFIPLENNGDEEDEQLEQEETQNNLRTLNIQKQQELRGIIKNYKVLQRNSNPLNMAQSRDQFLTDSSQRHLKAFHTQNLPPLGRAGPSMKSYLPPTYL